MKILVINSGSSSLKYQLFDYDNKKVIAKGLCERIGIADSNFKHEDASGRVINEGRSFESHSDAVRTMIDTLLDPEAAVIESLEEIAAVGHRIVHGGPYFSKPTEMTQASKDAVRKCYPWSPLHNPANLTGVEVCEKLMPGIPQVGVFDTAFHQTMPSEAYMYGLPYRYYEDHGVRRYGFHGTSHAFVARRAAELTQCEGEQHRLITCHLGNGSSFTAVKGGKCIDTSMGLTPLEGIMMGTRCGSIDPAIVSFIAKLDGDEAKDVDYIMNHESGVRGISGVSSDFRDLHAAASQGNDRAKLALRMFCYQAVKIIGSYIAALGGVDSIVFTAGIGENDDVVRQTICDGLRYLGLIIDEELNRSTRGKEVKISTDESSVEVFVIPTNEELSIAIQTVEVLGLI
ncbi:MAG TPA: acetate kinase [Bacillota bacterium]|nr:acetate kinase [Bacillota bacterium]HQC48209.1 acetate kinase [Bacillota bacterium]